METRYSRAAEEELLEAIEWYEDQEPGLGSEFLDEVDVALEYIRMLPNAWPRVSRRSRRCRLRRFPYGLVYQVRDNVAVIIAVMHLKRWPGYWRSREQ